MSPMNEEIKEFASASSDTWVSPTSASASTAHAHCLEALFVDLSLLFIHDHNARRQDFERQTENAVTLERQRISQELHDDLGQELTGLGLLADSLIELVNNESPASAVVALKIREGVRRTLQKVRSIAQGLAISVVNGAELPRALAELVGRLSESSKVNCVFIDHAHAASLDWVQATQIYYIAQEACTNALKHADAANVTVAIQSTIESYILRVQDDGGGIGSAPEGLGRKIMKNRAQLIGAKLTLEAAQPQGTLVTCLLAKEPSNCLAT